MAGQRRLGGGAFILILVALLAYSGCYVADFSGGAWRGVGGTTLGGVDPCAGVRANKEPKREPHNRLALVTGGAGFIGSTLSELLLGLGFRVRILDNLSTGSESFVKHLDLEFVKGDVLDFEVVKQSMKDVSYVFHLAAMSKVEPSLTDPKMIAFSLDVNVRGTANVMEAARLMGDSTSKSQSIPRVIYAASSTHYGNQPTPFREDAAEVLSSPYAHSKRSGEAVALLYGQLHAVPVISLRLFMVYGDREPTDGAYKVVTGVFRKTARLNKALIIEGDGTQFRDFVHVSDVAKAFVLAAQAESVTNSIFNVGTGVSTSIKSVADMISSDQKFIAPRKNDLRGTLADTCSAKRVLGFEAKRGFREEMGMAVLSIRGGMRGDD